MQRIIEMEEDSLKKIIDDRLHSQCREGIYDTMNQRLKKCIEKEVSKKYSKDLGKNVDYAFIDDRLLLRVDQGRKRCVAEISYTLAKKGLGVDVSLSFYGYLKREVYCHTIQKLLLNESVELCNFGIYPSRIEAYATAKKLMPLIYEMMDVAKELLYMTMTDYQKEHYC